VLRGPPCAPAYFLCNRNQGWTGTKNQPWTLHPDRPTMQGYKLKKKNICAYLYAKYSFL